MFVFCLDIRSILVFLFYRKLFEDFDPSAIAQFTEKRLLSLKVNGCLVLSEQKLRAVVDNAKSVLKVCFISPKKLWIFLMSWKFTELKKIEKNRSSKSLDHSATTVGDLWTTSHWEMDTGMVVKYRLNRQRQSTLARIWCREASDALVLLLFIPSCRSLALSMIISQLASDTKNVMSRQRNNRKALRRRPNSICILHDLLDQLKGPDCSEDDD